MDETQQALEQRLRRISLAQLIAELTIEEQENFRGGGGGGGGGFLTSVTVKETI